MLRGRDHAIILRIITLQSGDERYSHSSGKKRILTVGFLPASPSGIAEDINVRGPEVQALHDVPPAFAYRLVVFRSRFCADTDGHVMNQTRIQVRHEPNPFTQHRGCSS